MSTQLDPIHFADIENFLISKPSKSDRRRMQIIDQTLSELATVGADSTTHESLAKACGVSRALVQHYFPDRDELFLMSFRYARAKFQKICVDAIQKESTPDARLKAYIVTACSWPKAYPKDAKVWTLFFYNCAIDKKYRKLHADLVNTGRERLGAMMQGRGIENVSEAALLISNLITSYSVAVVTEEQTQEYRNQMLAATLGLCFQLAKLT